jgi:hypothetical protein
MLMLPVVMLRPTLLEPAPRASWLDVFVHRFSGNLKIGVIGCHSGSHLKIRISISLLNMKVSGPRRARPEVPAATPIECPQMVPPIIIVRVNHSKGFHHVTPHEDDAAPDEADPRHGLRSDARRIKDNPAVRKDVHESVFRNQHNQGSGDADEGMGSEPALF